MTNRVFHDEEEMKKFIGKEDVFIIGNEGDGAYYMYPTTSENGEYKNVYTYHGTKIGDVDSLHLSVRFDDKTMEWTIVQRHLRFRDCDDDYVNRFTISLPSSPKELTIEFFKNIRVESKAKGKKVGFRTIYGGLMMAFLGCLLDVRTIDQVHHVEDLGLYLIATQQRFMETAFD